MDKYEYKIRADEIKELISRGEYAQAAEIADTIDWRRVKSVMMLCTISDLYKINRRYEDARDMLLLAYERRPGGRTICYSLCELSIKMEEFVEAVEYYKEFVQVAPKDSGRYILQYKLYEAQDVSLEERIAVLEELKKRDYREKWAYELAYLYHRIGLAARCVEECDELILWFGEGKYVVKAMELKMLHEPLTPSQQRKYDNRYNPAAEEMEMPQNEEVSEEAPVEEPIPHPVEEQMDVAVEAPKEAASESDEEMNIQVKTVDVGQYNTINLQAELARGLKEVLGNEPAAPVIENPITRSIVAPMLESDTESLDYPEIDEVSEDDLGPDVEEVESTEVFFGETGEIGDLQQAAEDAEAALPEEMAAEEVAQPEEIQIEKAPIEEASIEETSTEETVTEEAPKTVPDITGEIVMEQLRAEIQKKSPVVHVEPPKSLAGVLSQESDGQIRLVMPERENIEKQITGQMNIEDILAEWERMKKENQQKREAEVRQLVLQHTGSMFTEFEAAMRDGLLEQLEREKTAEEATEQAAEAVTVETVQDNITEATEPVIDETSEEAFVENVPEEVHEEETFEEPAEEYQQTADEEVEAEVYEEEADAAAEEAVAEEAPEENVEENPIEAVPDIARVRSMTKEERELYAPYIQSRATRRQIVKAIDGISMAAYTGNLIITGEEGMDTMTLAKNMIREIQSMDSNFTGKVAKISGAALNQKEIPETLESLKNGALIVCGAAEMNEATVKALDKTLQQETLGIIIVLEENRKIMDKFLAEYEELTTSFTARVDVEAMSNDRLVAYGKHYAKEREYSIDELGMLALHTRIQELQTIDHVVTVAEVKAIVDEAIRHANRKTLGHFFDILFARRYDEEDMIILSEKDFA